MSDQSNEAGISLRDALKQLWWVMLLRGIALVVIGIYLVLRPGMTAALLTQIIGIFLIIEGILAIAASMLYKLPSGGWVAVRGIIAIMIGTFVFAQPALVAGITALVLLTILAIGVIAMGILELVATLKERDESASGPSPSLFSAILSLLLGVAILVAPITFGKVILMVLGIFAVISGLAHLAIAMKIRGATKAA